MPAADSRRTFRMDCSILSHASVTCSGSPEVSSTAFRAQPPDLPPVCLVDAGFTVLCQLAPHRRPHHPVLVHRLALLIHASFRPRLTTTPLRFSSPSPPPDRAGDFHSQAVEHVRHTKKMPLVAERLGNPEPCYLELSRVIPPPCAWAAFSALAFFAAMVLSTHSSAVFKSAARSSGLSQSRSAFSR